MRLRTVFYALLALPPTALHAETAVNSSDRVTATKVCRAAVPLRGWLTASSALQGAVPAQKVEGIEKELAEFRYLLFHSPDMTKLAIKDKATNCTTLVDFHGVRYSAPFPVGTDFPNEPVEFPIDALLENARDEWFRKCRATPEAEKGDDKILRQALNEAGEVRVHWMMYCDRIERRENLLPFPVRAGGHDYHLAIYDGVVFVVPDKHSGKARDTRRKNQ